MGDQRGAQFPTPLPTLASDVLIGSMGIDRSLPCRGVCICWYECESAVELRRGIYEIRLMQDQPLVEGTFQSGEQLY